MGNASLYLRSMVLCCALLVGGLLGFPAHAVTITQTLSRENASFQWNTSRFSVGRDGKVYLVGYPGYLMRISRDGTMKTDSVNSNFYNATGVAANANGIIAVGCAHFAANVALHKPDFSLYATVSGFTALPNYDAPADITVGASGDFYALDQYVTNGQLIKRMNAAGQIVATYNYPTATITRPFRIRVCEATQTFYILQFGTQGYLYAVGFDGTIKWSKNYGDTGMAWYDYYCGGYDVDDAGTLYTLGYTSNLLKKWDVNGNASGTVTLSMNPATMINGIAIYGNEVIVHRYVTDELFQNYNLTSGAQNCIVKADVDTLSMTFGSETWTAGTQIPFTIAFTSARPNAPKWHVWARPNDSTTYREFAYSNGQLTIPADCTGLYDLKLTPECEGLQRSEALEFRVYDLVEIRKAAAPGTITVYTVGDRIHYGAGENVNFTVSCRAPDANLPATVTVQLLDSSSAVIASGTASISPAQKTAALFIPASVTAGLRPGLYKLALTDPNLTCVAQNLVIGRGLAKSPFKTTIYGDYGGDAFQFPVAQERDVIASRATWLDKMGVNMTVERLPGNVWMNSADAGVEITNAINRFTADAVAVDPQKANPDSPILQTVASYSAGKHEQMAILLGNDCDIPIDGSWSFDNRSIAQLQADITTQTTPMLSFPAFRGWSWAANWWNWEKSWSNAASDPTEKANFESAVATAVQPGGAWSSLIDTVSDRRFAYPRDTWTPLNSTLSALAPGKVTATSGPYRNVDSYPPLTFATVDETDMQAQWEQYPLPYHTLFGVDYYKRPGKKLFQHPEVWNDTGTGEQVLTDTLMGVMRGTDGVGASANTRTFPTMCIGDVTGDGRNAYRGTVSVFRALNTQLIQRFGPWFTGMTTKDPVALVVSARMAKIDNWTSTSHLPLHFGRLYEAYVALMLAHYPASLVFTDDMTSTSLNGYKAIVLVDQRVEIEPNLSTTIANAKAAGAAVYYDGTSDATRFTGLGYTALGVSFNHYETTHGPGYDIASMAYLNDARLSVPTITTALAGITPPATVSADEVLVTERTAESGRYIFVLNDCQPTALSSSHLWRISTFSGSRLPLQTTVTLPNLGAGVVYDVLAQTQVTPSGGQVTADMRSVPMRIYAILPTAVNNVALVGPNTAVAFGQPFNWSSTVRNSSNVAIAASVPIRVQLLSNDRATVLQERYTAVGSAGASGTFTLPLNPVGGAPRLRVTELLTGRYAEQTLTTTTSSMTPAILLQGQTDPGQSAAVPASLTTAGSTVDAALPASAQAFGPHIRDLAVSADGSTVLCSTMNWDQNLYGVTLSSGAVSWRKRIGNYFAYDPQTAGSGFAAQGFNFNDAEGYGLYLVGADGTLSRRFNAYGLPIPPIGWMVSAIVETPSSYNFAVSPDGSKVASAANLGLAVWNNSGTLLWSQDWSATRQTARLAASNTTLITATGLTVSGYDLSNGALLWTRALAGTSGEVARLRISADGTTCAALSTKMGGFMDVFSCATGNPLGSFPTARTWNDASKTAGTDFGITPAGSLVAVTNKNQVTVYSTVNGYQWVFAGDETLHFPRFSPDGARLVVSSELGTVYVLSTSGAKLLEQDMGSLVAPAWLANGDLVLGGWNGKLTRLNSAYAQVWQSALTPTETDIRTKILDADGAPVTEMTNWSNALATPYALDTTILTPTNCVPQSFGTPSDGTGYHIQDNIYYASMPPSLLVDGSATPPASPWNIGTLTGGNTFYLQMNTWNRVMRVDAVTFAEDPAHPESWLRDAAVQYLDPVTQTWMTGPVLRSDVATHTHVISPSITTAQLRFYLPKNTTSGLRLGEVAVHGALLGGSHPDVAALRDTAVIFDEGTDLTGCLGGPWSFQMTDAFSGSRCLKESGRSLSAFWTAFGPTLPNWYFVVSANPQPGQYRYLRFSWKATSANVTSMALGMMVGIGGQSFYCGTNPGRVWDGDNQMQVSTTVPQTWTTVTVDLSQYFPDGTVITSPGFRIEGGDALFDRILLSRTSTFNELPSVALTNPGDGLAFNSGSTLTVSANASDLDGSVNRVEFYQGSTLIGTDSSSPYSITWSNIAAGAYTLTAKVFDDAGASTTSSPVNITVDNAPTVSITSPASGANYTAPASIPITAAASDTDGTITKVAFYLNGAWQGEDTVAPYAFTMNNIGTGAYALTVKATDNLGMVTESAAVNVSALNNFFTAGYTGSRTDWDGSVGYEFTPTQNITVCALGRPVSTAMTQNHVVTIWRVSDQTAVASVTVTPSSNTDNLGYKYALLAQNVTLTSGTAYRIVSYETVGGDAWMGISTISSHLTNATITQSVYGYGASGVFPAYVGAGTDTGYVPPTFYSTAMPNTPPTTSITAPANNAVYATAPATVALTANAADADGTITQVDFYQGSTLIGTDSSSPYTCTWSSVAAGSYSLTTKATDNLGAVTTSTAVAIRVNTPPTVSITAPTSGGIHHRTGDAITASASDTDGTVSQVQFFNNGILLGTDSSSPYTYSWANVEASGASGISLTAKATDNDGVVTTSSAVTYTVTDSTLKCYWKLNENTGTSAGDSAGSNAGTITGASWITGKISYALSFNGTSNYVRKTSATGLPTATAAQTECFWFYLSANPTVKRTALAVTGTSAGVGVGFLNSTTFAVWKNAGTAIVSTTTLPTAGAWHHVAYVKNGSTNYLYIDGVQKATTTTATDTAQLNTINLGRTSSGANYWPGYLDELRIYSRALSAAEITALAQAKQ